eukprot:307529-Lingulodinium_polyedra.AAC.1
MTERYASICAAKMGMNEEQNEEILERLRGDNLFMNLGSKMTGRSSVPATNAPGLRRRASDPWARSTWPKMRRATGVLGARSTPTMMQVARRATRSAATARTSSRRRRRSAACS